MSTEIKSLLGMVKIDSDPDGTVGVQTTDRSGTYGIVRAVSRADFIAAVEKECGVRIVPADAVVIERAELPDTGLTLDGKEVYSDSTGRASRWLPVTLTPAEAREIAARYVAIAEYLRAHPPVDPAVVEALTTDLRSVTGITEAVIDSGAQMPASSAEVAEALVRLGWRKGGAR